MTDARLAPLIPILEAASLDAAAVTPGPTFERLFGIDFHQNERPLMALVTRSGATAAIVPAIEASRFDSLGFDGPVAVWRDQDGYEAAFAEAAAALGAASAAPIETIGVEGLRLRFFEAEAVRRALPGARMVDAQTALSSLRLRKSQDEIAALRRAIAVSEAALERTLQETRIGMTEAEVERRLRINLIAEGADALAFDPIVAAGANAANLHAHARADYALADGDCLLIDFGARVDGFCADLTRTFFMGHVSEADRALYETVVEANRIGRESARPGLSTGALDDAVLTYLEATQFRGDIRHRTGHGLGREVHEEPYIMRGVETALAPGMVFTVEPGLYEIGRLGVRIEDDVVVTETGAESLSTFPRTLRVIDPQGDDATR